MSTWEVDVSHTMRRTFTVQASNRKEAEERALTNLVPANYVDGWTSDLEFSADAFEVME